MPSVHMCAGVGNKSLPSSGGFHSPEILFVFVNTTCKYYFNCWRTYGREPGEKHINLKGRKFVV